MAPRRLTATTQKWRIALTSIEILAAGRKTRAVFPKAATGVVSGVITGGIPGAVPSVEPHAARATTRVSGGVASTRKSPLRHAVDPTPVPPRERQCGWRRRTSHRRRGLRTAPLGRPRLPCPGSLRARLASSARRSRTPGKTGHISVEYRRSARNVVLAEPPDLDYFVAAPRHREEATRLRRRPTGSAGRAVSAHSETRTPTRARTENTSAVARRRPRSQELPRLYRHLGGA